MYTWLISLCLAALVNRVDAKFPKAMNNPHGNKTINSATNKRRQSRSFSFSHDVGCQEGSPPGLDYTGIANMTMDGRACQVWAESNSTIVPLYLEEHNKCRNPDHDINGVWCHTAELNDWGYNWDYCPVPKCMQSFLSIEAISSWNNPRASTLESE